LVTSSDINNKSLSHHLQSFVHAAGL